MNTFSMNAEELKGMEEKVAAALGESRVAALNSISLEHSLLCGCGAGGNCSSSCVSGCAERG